MIQGVIGHIWADLFRWGPSEGFTLKRSRDGHDTADVIGQADYQTVARYLAAGYKYIRYSTKHRSELPGLVSALNYSEADFFHSYKGEDVGLCDVYEGVRYGVINLQKQMDWWTDHPENILLGDGLGDD